MEPINLVFDMDDTLVRTNQEIYHRLGSFYSVTSGSIAKAFTLKNLQLEGKTTLELPAALKEDSWNHVVSKGEFMLTAEPTRLLCEDRPWLENLIKLVRQTGGKTAICTHRGFHKKALEYTTRWLERHAVTSLFDHIHVIDGREIPNKIEYLEKHYSHFKLVDDNPLHEIDKDPAVKDDRLLIFTETRPYRHYEKQTIVRSMFDIYQELGFTAV